MTRTNSVSKDRTQSPVLGILGGMTRMAVPLATLVLLAAACKPDAPPVAEPVEKGLTPEEKQAVLADIQAMLSGADAFSALSADLSYQPATEFGLRFKLILDASALNEMQFKADQSAIQPALILQPERLANSGGRQESLDAIQSLSIAYDRYVFAGSETESNIGRLFEQIAPGSVGDTVSLEPVEQNRINGILGSMLQAYANIIFFCSSVRPRLESDDLLFRDNEEVIEYERLVRNAAALESQLEAALRSAQSVRRARVDRAFANLQAALRG